MQPDRDKTRHLIEKALAGIDQHLHKQADMLLTFVPNETFLVYRQRLERYRDLLATGPLPARETCEAEMSREIIHNWPYTFVGAAIVEAERAFLACLPSRADGESSL